MHHHYVIDTPCESCVVLYAKVIGGIVYDIYRCQVTNKTFYVPVRIKKEVA